MKMKTTLFILILAATSIYLLLSKNDILDPQEFAEALKHRENTILIDLRSGDDFSNGHIFGATHIDYGKSTYKWRIAELDTKQDLFIYCKDGKRTKEAAVYLESQGFNSVTVLKGGVKAWLDEGFTLTPEELIPDPKLTFESFSRMLDLEHLVIVDFYLPGDLNSRAIEPVLDELAITYDKKIKILRIDMDHYTYLAAEMEIEYPPTLQLYENGNLCIALEGVLNKKDIEDAFRLKEYTATAALNQKRKQTENEYK
jgi:rhodanese-related sulfurtransferase